MRLSDLRVAVPRDFRGNEDRFDYKPATLEMVLGALLEQGAETLHALEFEDEEFGETLCSIPVEAPGRYLVFRIEEEKP